jgi:hypothetical protein
MTKIIIKNGTDIKINQDCSDNASGHGVVLNNASWCLLDNVTSNNNPKSGFFIRKGSHDNILQNCHASGNDTDKNDSKAWYDLHDNDDTRGPPNTNVYNGNFATRRP